METLAPPDAAARDEAVERLGRLAVPRHGLGRLEDLGTWLAACQGRCPARPPQRPRVVLLAADHGIATAGVSAYPAAETASRVAAVRRGDAAVSALASVAGAGVRVVDVGLGAPQDGTPPHDDRAVRRGGGRIDREDALTAEEVAAALDVGRAVADEEVDAGADLLIPAEIAVAVSTPTAVLAAALCGREPVAVVGRGSGIDDSAWMRKAAAVRDGLRRTRPAGRDAERLLGIAGGADLAALVGFLLQAARRRTPVLLDGAPVCVAALLADTLAAGAREWWTAATRDTEPAQALALEMLGLDPLLLLEMRAGSGTGALAALPLVRMAATALAETAAAP